MEEEQDFLKDRGPSGCTRRSQCKVRLRRKEVYLCLLWLWIGRLLQVGLPMEVKGSPPKPCSVCKGYHWKLDIPGGEGPLVQTLH